MKKFLLIISLLFLWPNFSHAANLAKDLSGRILLNVEANGEAWYVNPSEAKRYFLGRPADAFAIMRQLGLGISEIDFQKIAQSGMDVSGDLNMAKRLSGRIILETEKNGEAWYIYPLDLKKYYLGRPEDAFRIMRELSLGITRENLAKIHKPGTSESINEYSSYEHKKISTLSGTYTVDIVTVDLKNPFLKIVTDTANTQDCEKDCTVKSLAGYTFGQNGFAAINGSYFCTSSGCDRNYYFYPVYKSSAGVMLNEDQLKYWTTGPLMVFDANNKFYYFKDSRDLKSVAWFEENYRVKMQAAIGNKPRLIENGNNQLIDWEVDAKQKSVKTVRNAIGYQDDVFHPGQGKIYLVVAYNATVPDLADIMRTLPVEYALNLDGGSSSALIYNGEYMIGPGRDIPNAIIFTQE